MVVVDACQRVGNNVVYLMCVVVVVRLVVLVCEQGETPLHKASPYGNVDGVRLLLDNRAYVNATTIKVCAGV